MLPSLRYVSVRGQAELLAATFTCQLYLSTTVKPMPRLITCEFRLLSAS